jgi:hypothetical protein
MSDVTVLYKRNKDEEQNNGRSFDVKENKKTTSTKNKSLFRLLVLQL